MLSAFTHLLISQEAPKNAGLSVRPLQSSSRFNALRSSGEKTGEKPCVQVDASLRYRSSSS